MIDISIIISIISLIFAVIGGIFALVQWNSSNKVKRAEFINQIIEKLRFDKEMVDIMYKIEYDHEWYNDEFHSSGEFEYRIDKILSYLSYICYLKNTGNIKANEFKIFTYELNRTCISSSVQEYLWNLHHFSIKNNTVSTFSDLVSYGLKNGQIPKDFEDIKSDRYVKRLNF
jgi:hypothetical protein